jgi:thioredoxin 2
MSTDVITCDVCGKKNRVPAAATGIPRCGNCHSPLPWVTEADDETFEGVVTMAALPVLLDLWAPWCGPCRMVSPTLEKLAHDHRGQLKLVKVNVDVAPQIASRFGVQGIPTLVVMHRGDVVARQTGAAGEQVLRRWLDEALSGIALGEPS